MLLLLSVNRGLFIIDPSGVVRQVTINDLPVGRSVEEVLRLVKAFQFTDEHGEGNFMQPFFSPVFQDWFLWPCAGGKSQISNNKDGKIV